MKAREIAEQIEKRLGIGRLNAMQEAMVQTDAADIELVAPTGSGKTIAFAVRLLRSLQGPGRGIAALVVVPSRELALQVAEVLRRVAVGFKVTALYGGHRFDDEANSLSVLPDIVVATPGRLLDHINRRTLDVSSARALVLDEYDKSLELGFADEMSRIVRRMSSIGLRILTSATSLGSLPSFIPHAERFAKLDFSAESGAPEVEMPVVEVPSPVPDKLDTLSQLLASLDNVKVIVFANHRESAERIYGRLKHDRFPVALYHGALDQSDRRHALQLLANGTAPILVATDLAARGLDIPEVEAVVHYHLPLQASTWTHRNGRTARQGASGTVYAIVADGETVSGFIRFDRSYVPKTVSANGIRPTASTLHINSGRKEKISRGDVLGFLVKSGGVDASSVGTIVVDDHEAVVGVAVSDVRPLLERLNASKLKGKRVRVTIIE